MTDNTTTQTGEAAAQPQPTDARKSTVDLVTERRCFPTLADAGVALAAIAAASIDWDSTTIVAPGATFEGGEFVPVADEWTAPSHEIMLAPLATKTEKDKDGNVTKPARLIALVLTPIPTVDALLDDEKGEAMVREVIRKELNHRAVRKLRAAENVTAAATEMPLSIESFATSQVSGTASGLAAFDDHWLIYSQALAKKVPGWAARFPGGKGKAAIRGAVENKAKAAALFSELEAFGPKGESLFVRLLQGTIKAATAAGKDTTLLQAWLDTRDAQTYDAKAEATADLDLDDLFADMDESEAEGDNGESGESGESDPEATPTPASAEANAQE